MKAERREEIREAYESTRPEDRDPADIAIGELLAALDEAEDMAGVFMGDAQLAEHQLNLAEKVVEAARDLDFSTCGGDTQEQELYEALTRYDKRTM